MNPATIEGFQMSAQQLHLWKVLSLDQSPSYRVQFTIVIDGSLEIDTLRQAVEGLVSRHEILRTSLRRFPGMAVPVQVIAEPEECAAGFDFNYHDAGDNGHDNDSLRLAAETFDLENGPLVRGA